MFFVKYNNRIDKKIVEELKIDYEGFNRKRESLKKDNIGKRIEGSREGQIENSKQTNSHN